MDEKILEFYEYLVDKKCKDITLYANKNDDENQYIFVVTNASALSNKKFAQTIMDDFQIDTYPEGFHKGEWIVFDFGRVVLHSFIASVRDKYSLDKLYNAKKVTINKQNKK